MNNTNSTLKQLVDSKVTDDTLGAIIFIIVVLLWYSSSIVFLLGMQIGRSCERIEDSTKRPTKLFVQDIRGQNNNQEILKELVDKQKRDKLWDIYLGTSGDMNDKITRAEVLRIRNIERQLATMNKYRRNSTQRSLDDKFSNHSNQDIWSTVTDLSSLRPRRRSSLDYKILKEWRSVTDEFKTYEHWPWAIQKRLIRRNLRRQRHASECRFTS